MLKSKIKFKEIKNINIFLNNFFKKNNPIHNSFLNTNEISPFVVLHSSSIIECVFILSGYTGGRFELKIF